MRNGSLMALSLCAALGLPPACSGAVPGSPTRPGADSPFGIDYVFPYIKQYQKPELPAIFAETGARWVNFAGPGLGWRSVEPRPPRKGRHSYRWKELDRAVRAWQEAGFQIAMTLTCGSPWGGGPVTGEILLLNRNRLLGKLWEKKVDRLPSPEHMADYRAYITALVERYDGDGVRDMPGLIAPVLHYQVGNEYVHEAFWGGTLKDYGTLLRETSLAARAACPDVKIILAGITWNDLFLDDPEGVRFEERFAAKLRSGSDIVRKGWKKARRFTEGELAFARWYDIIDARGNGPFPGAFPGYIAWLKRDLAARGISREIWDMESRTEPAVLYNGAVNFHREAFTPGGASILKAMGKSAGRDKDATWRWYRAEQARQTVKVLATRLGEGVEKVFIGFPIDNDFNVLAKLGSGGNPWIGLLDRKYRRQAAFYAYRQFVSKVGGFREVTKHVGGGLWHYTFASPERTMHVLWYDDGRPPDPRRAPAEKEVSLALECGRIAVTPAVTSLDNRDPAARVRRVEKGKAVLALSSTPLFVEELPRAD